MPISSATDIEYTNPTARTEDINYAVMQFALHDPRNLCFATVRCIRGVQYDNSHPSRLLPYPESRYHLLTDFSGGYAWHRGGTNPDAPWHITVMYYDREGIWVCTVHLDADGYEV